MQFFIFLNVGIGTVLAVPDLFGYAVFPFLFISGYFFSLDFFFDPLVFRSVFNCHIFLNFRIFLLLLISGFMPLWLEEVTDRNSLRFVSWPGRCSVLESVLCPLEKDVCPSPLPLGRMLFIYPIGSSGL